MGDLGALQFVQMFDFERWSDQDVYNVIDKSNIVYNVIGSWRGETHKPFRNPNQNAAFLKHPFRMPLF